MRKFYVNRCFVFLVLFILLIGCATTSKKRLKSFNVSTVNSLQVGMTTYEIEKLFGPPDSQYLMTFGEDTEESWQGLVYHYYTIRDPHYETIDVRLSNTFVFYANGSSPKLNHWKIQYTNKN
jgi:hypothetical protein